MTDLQNLINEIIPLAIRWKAVTQGSLGVTVEIGEYLACTLMAWSMAEHLQAGWDATDADGRRIQIVPDATIEMSVIFQPETPPHSASHPQPPVHQGLLPGPCGE